MTTKHIILILIEHYLPGTKTGGPVRSVSNLVDWLGDEFDFRILTSNHDKGESEPYPGIEQGKWYPVGKAQVRYLTPQEKSLLGLRQIIRATPHDVLQLESLLARTTIQALLLCRFALLKHQHILIAPRGHLGEGALKQKSLKKLWFLRAVKLLALYRGLNWYATSDGERDEIIQHFGHEEAARVEVIPNLPTRSIQIGEGDRPEKRPGYVRIVFLSRIARKKNLHFALETLRGLDGDIVFDIYGNIEDVDYWMECQRIIATLPANVKARYCGVVPFEHSVRVMVGYHLFYLPTLHENYGHVILEALLAGCPVLISDQTPWQDVEVHGVGWALRLDQPETFIYALRAMIKLDEAGFLKQAHYARSFAYDCTSNSDGNENLIRLLIRLSADAS